MILGIILLLILKYQNKEALVIIVQSGIKTFDRKKQIQSQYTLSGLGMRQQYLLGKYYKQKYSDLFGERLNFNQLKIFSSFKSNAQVSAQSFLNGIYDVNSFNKKIKVDKKYYQPQWEGFNIDIDFQEPLPKGIQQSPIHTTLLPDLYFGTFSESNCPMLKDKFQELQEKFYLVINQAQYLALDTQTFVDIQKILPRGIHSMDDVKLVLDYVLYKQQIGKAQLDKYLYLRWLYLKSVWIYTKFYRNKNFMKFHVSQMLNDIKDFIENVYKKEEEDKKIFIIEADQINLYTLLTLQNNIDFDCLITKVSNIYSAGDCDHVTLPSSSISFYLKDDQVTFTVNGKEQNFCKNKICKFEEFQKQIKNLTLTGTTREQIAYYCDSRFGYISQIWRKFLFSFTIFLILLFMWLLYDQVKTKQ